MNERGDTPQDMCAHKSKPYLGHSDLEVDIADLKVAEVEVRGHNDQHAGVRGVLGHMEHDAQTVLVVHVNRRAVACWNTQ